MKADTTDIGVPEPLHDPLKTAQAGNDCVISAQVTNETNLKPQGMRLHYRVSGGQWTNTSMRGSGNGKFTGIIPAQPAGATVEYYLKAGSVFNTSRSLPVYAPYDTFSYKVTGSAFPAWAWGAAGAAILVCAAAILWYIRRIRMSRRRSE